MLAGEVALDGGWRVYSSGAGIALALIIRRFLGLSHEASALSIDPVIPVGLDGLRVEIALLGRPFEVIYTVRGSGFGVTAVHINGASLPITFEHNPYRKGAARVAISSLEPLLVGGKNSLAILVGE
jgi:cellobiose phosphorylase